MRAKAATPQDVNAAAHGGDVYRYSADTIWFQPPGTPAVGMAMLDAPVATKDEERGWMRDAGGKKTRPAGGVIYSLDFVQNVKAPSVWVKAQK